MSTQPLGFYETAVNPLGLRQCWACFKGVNLLMDRNENATSGSNEYLIAVHREWKRV